MEWGKISKLMESEMSNCLLIWLIELLFIQTVCLNQKVIICLSGWLFVWPLDYVRSEWPFVWLTFDWPSDYVFVCLHVYMFLCFFVILLVFSSVYVHLLLFICVFDSMFVGLFDCFDTVLGSCLNWTNDCLFDCSREWLSLFNWVNTCMLECFFWRSDWGRVRRECLTVSSDCLFD